MVEGEEVRASPLYKDRDEWRDVTPILPTPEELGVVRIAADETFTDAHAYLRAVLQTKELSERCILLTDHCIQLNPANYTVWQYRRDLLRALNRDLAAELRFIGDIILENPKNYQVWHHRRTIIDWLDTPRDELAFTAEVLSDEPKNYHAWQHRQWIVRRFELAGSPEIDFATKLILEDPRNNSAWNYRYFIHQLAGNLESKDTVDIELNFCKQLASKMPRNESVWNYLSGLLLTDGLTSRPDIIEWAEDLYGTTVAEERAHHLVSFLLDVEIEKIEKGMDGGVEHVNRAKKLCDELLEIDPVRSNYWAYQRIVAENTHERFMLNARQF